MADRETSRLIIVPHLIEELVHHDISRMEKAVGPIFKFMDGTMVPESDVTVLIRRVERDISADSEIGPSLHSHDANQLYCLLGDVKLEVTLEDDQHRVTAPAAILVPAGMKHAIRYAGGTGYVVNILSKTSYS